MATFSTVPLSEIAAVKTLLGEIDIRGRLPVSIPGLAAYGEGIQVRATRAPAPPATASSAAPAAADGQARQ